MFEGKCYWHIYSYVMLVKFSVINVEYLRENVTLMSGQKVSPLEQKARRLTFWF